MTATIVMPVYNGSSTLLEVFDHLENQKHKDIIDELIIINDNSNDNSGQIISKYIKISSFKCTYVLNESNKGLAANYNIGIHRSKSQFVITMHQDIVLSDENSFLKIIEPCRDRRVAASYPTLIHPVKIWLNYPFWQKAMFSRFINKKVPILSGKFDCFNVTMLKSVGYFDSVTYRTAGEDGDIKQKFNQHNQTVTSSGLDIVHIHSNEANFGVKKYIKKEIQIAEAQGVLLRKYGIAGLKNFFAAFFRQILILGLIVPFVNKFAIIMILLYSFAYVSNLYIYKTGGLKLIILPFINVFILFMATIYSIKGFYMQRQRL